MANGFPDNKFLLGKQAMEQDSPLFLLTAKAPTGKPPPITFPKQIISASTFNNS
jgi:hypothetical protein